MISLFLLPAAPQSGRYKKYIHFSLRPSHRGIWKEEEERNEIYIFPVIFPFLVFLRIRRHTFSRRPIFALSILLVFYPLSPLLPFPRLSGKSRVVVEKKVIKETKLLRQFDRGK